MREQQNSLWPTRKSADALTLGGRTDWSCYRFFHVSTCWCFFLLDNLPVSNAFQLCPPPSPTVAPRERSTTPSCQHPCYLPLHLLRWPVPSRCPLTPSRPPPPPPRGEATHPPHPVSVHTQLVDRCYMSVLCLIYTYCVSAVIYSIHPVLYDIICCYVSHYYDVIIPVSTRTMFTTHRLRDPQITCFTLCLFLVIFNSF